MSAAPSFASIVRLEAATLRDAMTRADEYARRILPSNFDLQQLDSARWNSLVGILQAECRVSELELPAFASEVSVRIPAEVSSR